MSPVKIEYSTSLITVDEFALMYDKCAAALYGDILRNVQHKEIAEKILEKVFLNMYEGHLASNGHLRVFTNIMNHSRRKTAAIQKALRIMEACSCKM